MRKIVKPAVKCKSCGHITEFEKTEEFCDQCKKLIDTNKVYPLRLTVFVHGAEETYDANLCSWECVKRYLIDNKKKVLKAEFITLPYPSNPHGNDKDYASSMEDFFRVFLRK
jgi:hypothetical protein